MEPAQTSGTLKEDGETPTGSASPALIGAEVTIALALAALFALVLQRSAPSRPIPRQITHRPAPAPTPTARSQSGQEAHPADETAFDESPTIIAEMPVGEVAERPQLGVISLFQSALGRSRALLRSSLDRVLGRVAQDPAAQQQLEELEEALLRADVGVQTTERLVARVREVLATTPDPERIRAALRSEMRALLDAVHAPLSPRPDLWVILVVGVNGSGKTTTIGKLAARLKGEGRKVLLAAGDTFRAAAEQQLTVWAERSGVDIVSLEEGADPGAVAFKALERAKSEGHDVVIIDTAGRLQTRKPLMEQLGKVRRVLDKALPGAPHETLLVLDGTIGQNGLSQAKLFHEVTPITGVVITKLDGTAKGGMVLAVATEVGLPIKLVGLGEKINDLRDFEPAVFVEALL